MRRISGWLAGAMALLLASSASGAGAEPVRIAVVADGKSSYAIVVPDDADAGRIGQASELLQAAVARITGVKLPVVKESALQKGTPAIYLGKSQAARRAGLDVDKVTGWAYLNQVVGSDIFLVGADGAYPIQDKVVIQHLGTLKAVTAFLEDQGGVRFALPGEYGTNYPKSGRLAVDAGMKKSWAPLFDYVIGRAPPDPVVAVAGNLFQRTPTLFSYGGHSYYDAVPEKVYAKTHPEYFALLGGVRASKDNHLCISNPEVQELMLKEMEKELDKGYEWVELAQTDGYQPCQCAACRAISGDPGEALWIVHRKLAEEMLKRRPGKKVMIISYGPTVNPPKSFKSFPENVVIQMCHYEPEAFDEWAPYNVDKSVYVYNWGQYHTPGFAPKRTPRYAVEQVRMFLKNRVRGIYICGGFTGGQGAYGLEGPEYYAYGKALGDPSREPGDLLKEYVDAVFQESAVPMHAFFAAMHDRLDVYSVFDRPNGPAVHARSPFQTQEEYFCFFFPPNLLNDMTRNLQRAKAMAAQDSVKANLQLVETEFNYVKNLAGVFQLYRAYRLDPNLKALDLLAAKVAERGQLIEALYPNGKLAQIKGLPPPFIGASKSSLVANGRDLGAPLNWDFALLRERGILPGVGSKSVEAPRVAGMVLDGNPDKPVWKQAQFQELSEIGMGALKNASRFKAAYDAENLYLAFVCEFSDLDTLDKLKPAGRDGPAYYQECIEIMLDPFGQREKYCHLIFNPVPDSTFDRRFGYITDPLDPRYGKGDVSWNGKWDYVAAIDRERKRWTAEVRIPFTTLEAQPPQPGAVWTMNIGRTEFLGGNKDKPVYSLWSPNLETRSFHDTSTFGDVVFK